MFIPNSPKPPSGIAQTEELLNSQSNLSRKNYRTTHRLDARLLRESTLGICGDNRKLCQGTTSVVRHSKSRDTGFSR